MEGRDWHKEWWVRLYTRESNEARGTKFLARATRDALLRYARTLDGDGSPTPDSGVLVSAATTEKAIEMLMHSMSVQPDEWEVVREFILYWIDDGYLVWRKRKRRHALCIENYISAQTAKSPAALRAARYRANKKKRQQGQQLPLGTRNVTRHATSHAPRHGGVTAEKEEEEEQNHSSEEEGGGRDASRADRTLRARAWLGDEDAQAEAGDIGLAHRADFVVRVIRCCDEVWGQRTVLRTDADPRVKTILERVAEGFAPADLEAALRGSASDDFIRANPKLQTVSTLLKNPDAVDKYIRAATAPKPSPGPKKGSRPTPAIQPEAGQYRDSGWSDLRGESAATAGTGGSQLSLSPALADPVGAAVAGGDFEKETER